ncbi:MAG: hypothetical protein R3D67_10820 [Hyphomicrobiaceae bacterium]
MKTLSLSAGVVAAVLALAAAPATAADLDYRTVPPPDRYGSAYDDPRYRDLYGPEPQRPYAYAPEPYEPPHVQRYEEPPVGPVPPGYVYRDRYAGRYSEPEGRYGPACLPRHVIRRHLVRDGWSEFQDIDAHGPIARVKARRANGDLFQLKVDRCTGDIVKAQLLERYDVGPYAYRAPAERYQRRYY